MQTYIVQPTLKNSVRQNVVDWCYSQFGDRYKVQGNKEYLNWAITSDYNRGINADFSFLCINEKDAVWFAMKFGGNIVVVNTN